MVWRPVRFFNIFGLPLATALSMFNKKKNIYIYIYSYNLLIKDRLKSFRKARYQKYRAVDGGIRAVTVLRKRLYVSNLPPKRIGKSRET